MMKLRIKSPCMDCLDRFCGCHSTCEMYKNYKERLEYINNLRMDDNKIIDDYKAIRRAHKRKKWK